MAVLAVQMTFKLDYCPTENGFDFGNILGETNPENLDASLAKMTAVEVRDDFEL